MIYKKTKQKLMIFIVLITMFLFGCGSDQTKMTTVSGIPILIETKAQIKNAEESNQVKIEIALDPQKAVRMEVTGTLGIRVASILLTPQKIQYALHTSETYGEGPFSAKTIYPIFKTMIDPRMIWKIIHNQNPETSDFHCKFDDKNRPVECQHLHLTTVKWIYEESSYHKKISIKNNQFEMNWIFKNQSILSESQNETFVLKKPEGYKEILIK